MKTKDCGQCGVPYVRKDKECRGCGAPLEWNRKRVPTKVKLTELELIEKQAAKMLKDMARLQATQTKSVDQKDKREGVDIWKDSDFFFSVVFQSAHQKYVFLEEFSKLFKLGIDQVRMNDSVIQVINGLKLAQNLQIKLEPEKMEPYPYPDLELKALALDNDKF